MGVVENSCSEGCGYGTMVSPPPSLKLEECPSLLSEGLRCLTYMSWKLYSNPRVLSWISVLTRIDDPATQGEMTVEPSLDTTWGHTGAWNSDLWMISSMKVVLLRPTWPWVLVIFRYISGLSLFGS